MKLTSVKQAFDRLLASYYQLAVGEKAIRQPRLVMTLLARDEADIIEANILFHLNHGVDFIIATDNGSVDGTREILEAYERQGVLHLIREPSRVLDQAAWVNRMGRIAHSEYNADFIFHCDADEFWYPRSGSLKRELLARPRVDVLAASFVNVLMHNKNSAEVFPDDAIYAATNPIRKKYRELTQEVDKTSFLLFRYPKKVIYKLRAGYLEVGFGNHSIIKTEGSSPFRAASSHDISIYHFPVRGLEQFARKVMNGGEARENYQKEHPSGVSPTESWQFSRWLALSRSGKLFEEYNRLNLSHGQAKEQLEAGVITVRDKRHLALIEFLSRSNLRPDRTQNKMGQDLNANEA